ncbi:MAG TPA: hypothetical protein V6D23_14980, partial [Candidatus Obscuribacterales bacterium]
MSRLLIASDRGYLRIETVAHLARGGFPITAASSGAVSRGLLEALGVKTLEQTLPQWPQAPEERTKDGYIKTWNLMTVPQPWLQALAACDVVIYASEPRERWEAWAPDYTAVCHAPLELFRRALDAGVKRFIFLSAGKALGFKRELFKEEWDGNVYQETIDDAFECQRGVRLPEAAIHNLYIWYLHKRQYGGFWGFLAKPPVTEEIWLFPDYEPDPEYARTYD